MPTANPNKPHNGVRACSDMTCPSFGKRRKRDNTSSTIILAQGYRQLLEGTNQPVPASLSVMLDAVPPAVAGNLSQEQAQDYIRRWPRRGALQAFLCDLWDVPTAAMTPDFLRRIANGRTRR